MSRHVTDLLQDDELLLDALRLSLVTGIGPRLTQVLLERFGTPREVLAAPPDMLRAVPGIGPKVAAALFEARSSDAAQLVLARCRQRGVNLLAPHRPDFPNMLREIPDPPAVLYCQGQFEPRDSLAIAMVGSRSCTPYGRQMAEKLAGGLARAGMTVVSGLARGIDGFAHRGALQAGGRTIAVLATGVDEIYPAEHVELAREVAAQGAVVSESSLGQKPLAGLFPQRNRIISGLSLGVIVVEASRKSGALHTARHAMEQGREVFAIPGRIDSPASGGCHDLIRDGARLVTSVDDILEELGPLTEPVAIPKQPPQPPEQSDPPATEEVHSPRELSLSDQERQILSLVPKEPVHIDEILRHADIEHSRILSTLTVLEMKRMVRRYPGGNYCRC
ncbi:hypothetical protein Mal52_62080 [Symmachiella dynata]|uniref:Helix-hairpin-helix DNA-binding motif class 1 domain-containing protein n=1 Tax=Symmachiella dynata TaxID=2527995 RepID=A0A517ZZ06_9PLAN|nr:hypothetical protein Mal52_62080 [Symmachiella dynata]